MSIEAQINRINANIADAYSKAAQKGAVMPEMQNSENLPATIESIQSGGPGERQDPVLLKFDVVTLPLTEKWGDLAYGDGKFVAISGGVYGNESIYSTDGITWNVVTMPGTYRWTAVVYGAGKFVALAHNSSNVAYSTDCVTWELAPISPTGRPWSAVAYGGGRFVAVGAECSAYSTDGVEWTFFEETLSITPSRLVYGDNKFVAVEGYHIAYSFDGAEWTFKNNAFSNYINDMKCHNGVFVAAADSGVFYYSNDGIEWVMRDISVADSFDYNGVDFNNDVVVAVGYSRNFMFSTNLGENCFLGGFDLDPPTKNWSRVVFGGNKFVAIAYNSNVAAYSSAITYGGGQ